MKPSKNVVRALLLALLGFAGFTRCKPELDPEGLKNGLPRCRPDVYYAMYGPPTCYWETRATMPEWLEPSESAVLFIDEINDRETE